jgi:hypothetical protein
MGDADDDPDQTPLSSASVEDLIYNLLPRYHFDLIITHSLDGEYTRHRRHEEVGRAVVALWQSGRVTCEQLWMFAYADSGRGTYPVALPNAHFIVPLPEATLEAKRSLLFTTYGFGPNSWEGLSMPTREAFWCFDEPTSIQTWHREQVLASRSNTVVDWGSFR